MIFFRGAQHLEFDFRPYIHNITVKRGTGPLALPLNQSLKPTLATPFVAVT